MLFRIKETMIPLSFCQSVCARVSKKDRGERSLAKGWGRVFREQQSRDYFIAKYFSNYGIESYRPLDGFS